MSRAAVVVWFGVQPPNEKALIVAGGLADLLLLVWWLGVRRIFRGPSVLSATAGAAAPALGGPVTV